MFRKKKQTPIRALIGERRSVFGELRVIDGLRIEGEVPRSR